MSVCLQLGEEKKERASFLDSSPQPVRTFTIAHGRCYSRTGLLRNSSIMASKANGVSHLAGDISFSKTPAPLKDQLDTGVECGVRVTNVREAITKL